MVTVRPPPVARAVDEGLGYAVLPPFVAAPPVLATPEEPAGPVVAAVPPAGGVGALGPVVAALEHPAVANSAASIRPPVRAEVRRDGIPRRDMSPN
ncbi:MAG TPA: hypothetical protein PKA99_13930 [Dermatophilaceae bacterium]|nr:hypothetical protein [Dermatophilaceae bacterium]